MGFVGFEINSIVRTTPQRDDGILREKKRKIASIAFAILLCAIGTVFFIYGPPVSVLARQKTIEHITTTITESLDTDANNLGSSETLPDDLTVVPENNTETPIVEQAPATPETIVYQVKAGDNLGKIWKQHGAPQYGGTLAAEAWKKVGVSLKSLRVGDELELIVAEGDIREVRRTLINGDRVVIKGDSKNGYEPELSEAQTEELKRTVSGTISSSFIAAARGLNVPYPVIDEVVDLFSNRVEFRRSLQPGDSFSVTYVERRCKETGAELQPGSIVSSSLFTNGSLFAAVSYTAADGKARYYDERGNAVGSYFLRYPVQFSRISSVFSGSRFHPVLRRVRAHNGVDFAAPTGTPVRAVGDGYVKIAAARGGSGNMVLINHNDRYATAYLHLSKISVRPGTRVARGQVIGTVGMTGLATGPHLHFSMYDKGRYIDPLNSPVPVIAPSGAQIPAAILRTELNAIKLSHQSQAIASFVEKLIDQKV